MSIETDLTRIADALERLAATLCAAPVPHRGSAPVTVAPPTVPTPAAAAEPPAPATTTEPPAPAAAAEPPMAPPAQPEPTQPEPTQPEPATPEKITLEVLRARFRDLSAKGKRDHLMKIIESYGVDRLPLIDAKHYPAIAQQIAALEAA